VVTNSAAGADTGHAHIVDTGAAAAATVAAVIRHVIVSLPCP
jgi:hypothetical protein